MGQGAEIYSGGLRLSFSVRTRGGFLVVMLGGALDLGSAPVLREQLRAVLAPGASLLVVDLSGVSSCDANGLAVLIGADRRARLLGGTMRLAAPAPAVAAVLRSTGLYGSLDIFPTVLAATTIADDLTSGQPAANHTSSP